MAAARAVVCNNTSTLHVAEALGTPCAVMTGPSITYRWGVFRPHSRNIVAHPPGAFEGAGLLACHPCREGTCVRPDRRCIDEIGVADVIAALQDMRILPPDASALDTGPAYGELTAR